MKNINRTIFLLLVWVPFIFGQDKIQGSYSYTYGDKESLVEARQTCKDLAVRDAIESYYVFMESSTNVENFQTKEDIIQSIAAGYLKNLNIVEQKEEGRTITMVVEATVMPEEVKNLVRKIADQDEPKGEKNTAVPAPQDVQAETKNYSFAEALARYQNQLDSVDGAWEKGDREQMITFLQKAQKYLENHQPDRTERFWVSVYQCENLRMDIILDLLRVEHFERQGKRIRARKIMMEIRKNTDALKTGVNKLEAYSRLAEKQESVRSATVSRCRRTIDRVRNKSAGYKRL